MSKVHPWKINRKCIDMINIVITRLNHKSTICKQYNNKQTIGHLLTHLLTQWVLKCITKQNVNTLLVHQGISNKHSSASKTYYGEQ